MSRTGEILQIHIGQAGVQVANACWELYCLEHCIQPNGVLCSYPEDDSYSTFFDISELGNKVVPRLVMVDTEPTVIDEIRTGAYRNLFHPQSLVSGKEDSGSNFARAYNFIGNELIDRATNAVRAISEKCSNLRGIILFRAIGGGTGSGLGTLLLEKLTEIFGPKPTKIEFVLFPSPSLSPVIVEPYNAILATHTAMDFIDVSFILDNEALYEICATKLDVHAPTYTNLNRIVGQAISAFTASQRFYGSNNISFEEFSTNLVPYPRIHYPLLSYAPIISVGKYPFVDQSVESLTNSCFAPGHQLVRCNPDEGKYMSCVMLYRGNVDPSSVNNVLKGVKSRTRFVDWAPSGFKVGINNMPPVFVPGSDLAPSSRAILALSNNTNIQTAWCRIIRKFDQLFTRRAFIYHYVGEGMEEGTFTEAGMNLCQLVCDYKEVDDDAAQNRNTQNSGDHQNLDE